MAVTTALNSGTLTISGNNDASDIAIIGTANPGEITVTGRNGTMVNGVANGSTTIQGVTRHINATMGDGENVINVDNVYLAGHLEIFTGEGNDRVILGATGVVSTTLHCIVATGHGNDELRAEDYKVLIAGRLEFDLGGGNDSATLIGASSLEAVSVRNGGIGSLVALALGVTSGGALALASNTRASSIAVFTSAASAQLIVDCTAGQHSIYIDTCYSGTYIQASSVARHVLFPRPAPIAPPHNIDATITIARCQTPQIVALTGGGEDLVYLGGNDRLVLYGNNVIGPPSNLTAESHVVYIETGDGNDSVQASYNVMHGNFFATLEEANDALSLTGNTISGFASVDGGDGGNLLNLLGNQFGGFAASRYS
jgi:hypothetical protein